MRKRSDVGKTALLVCSEAPFPVVGGGALRTASLATYLSAHYALDLVVFREPGSPEPRLALPKGLVREMLVIDLPAHRKDAWSKALRNLHRLLRFIPPHEDRFRGHQMEMSAWLGNRQYDLVCLEHFWTTSYADFLRPRSRRLVCDLHNVESVFYETRAAAAGPLLKWVWRRFAAANRVLESARLTCFDTLLVTSKEDAERVNLPSTIVYPNALPLMPVPEVAKRQMIAFSGYLEFPPNIEALKWFGREIWPRLAQRFPELEFRVIGKGDEFVRPLLAGLPRVTLTGPVADALLELAAAQVAVVPIRSGSGTRLKILEAWAAGTAVVSTPLGAEGLDAGDAVRLAGSNDEFFNAIEDLLTNNSERDRMVEAGRGLYERRFTWPLAWRALESNEI